MEKAKQNLKSLSLFLVLLFCIINLTCVQQQKKTENGHEESRFLKETFDSIEKKNLTIDLSDRNLNKIPDEIFSRIEIQELILRNNNIRFVSDSISLLKELKLLDISLNELYSFPDAVLKLEKLEVLILNNNHISTIPQTVLKSKSLRSIYLQGNQITVLPDSLTNSMIEEIFLAHNELNDFFKYIGSNKLKTLDVSSNKLTVLSEEIMKLNEIELLDFSGNLITSVSGKLFGLPKLSYVFLHGNRIKNIYGQIIIGDSLKQVGIKNNLVDENILNQLLVDRRFNGK